MQRNTATRRCNDKNVLDGVQSFSESLVDLSRDSVHSHSSINNQIYNGKDKLEITNKPPTGEITELLSFEYPRRTCLQN